MTSQNITVNVNDIIITVEIASVGTANYVAENGKFFFDGASGDTYLMYNSTTSRLEIWVDGVKQKEFGEVTGNPF